MAEDLSNLNDQLANTFGTQATGLLAPDRQPEGGGFLSGAIASTLSALPEAFLGSKPPAAAQAFREAHPVVGFATEIIPNLIPYMAAEKAATAIPKWGSAIESFAEKGSTPITQEARRMVATMAPVEAAKVAGTAVANPDEVGNKVKESLFNLGLEAGVGGIVGALKVGGKVTPPPLPKAEFGADLKSPAQLKISDLKEKLSKGEVAPEFEIQVRGQIADLESQIRLEKVGDRKNWLKIDLDGDGDGREISRYFRDEGSRAGNIRKARLVRSAEDFADDAEKTRVIKAAGLEGNFEHTMLPRYVTTGADQWAKKISDDLLVRGKMSALDENTLGAREKSGLWVIAKKITGKIDAPKAGDEWVIFRTDAPGKFTPEVSEFADKMAARMAFLRQDNVKIDPKRPASILDTTRQMVAQTPIRDFRKAEVEYGALKSGADKIAARLGFKPGEEGSSFLANRAAAVIDQYLTPKLYQFSNSPIAKYVIGHSDRAFSQAKYLAQKLIHGDAGPDLKKFSQIFGDPDSTGMYKGTRSIKAILDSLDESDIHKMQEVADIVAGVDDPVKTLNDLRAAGEITEKLHAALLDFDKIDGGLVDDIINHQVAAGRNDLNPMKGHLMLSRVWEGDFRAPIANEAGQFLYVAGGKTPEAADALAKKIIEESGLKGVKAIPAERFDSLQDLKLAEQIVTRSKDYGVLSAANTRIRGNPVTFRERTGVEGYKTKFSRKEMFDRIANHVNERYNYMARVAIDVGLEKELTWLRDNDPKTFSAVTDRLRQMQGKPGPVAQYINAATDKILKPALGRNSATKISNYLNESVHHLQLGFGNIAFPALNAITFVQTVLPELAYVMNGADNTLMRNYYDVFIAGGKDLKPRGSVGALSPMKLLIKSFGQMKNADEAYLGLLTRAHREGVIDPKLLDDFIGKTSEMATKVSDVMKGEEPFINLLRTWSSWLPSKSERFARGQAFTSGYLVGKDIIGLQDEALYQFARKFTERTMFNYATQDRATLMTGPLGRAFGLFKNWQTHYIFSMMQYADEGYRYGNWSPLLWQMGGTAAVGGVAALPMYAVADSFAKLATDKSLMQSIYGQFGPSDPDSTGGTFSDAIYMGLPAFMGISLTGNAAAPLNDPSRDAAALMSFPQWDRMRRLGVAVGDSIERWAQTGNHPIADPAIRDNFIAALSPKALARSVQITQENALRSLNTGNVILKDMSLAEKMMWQVGLTPRRVGLAYEAADELWKDQKKKKERTSAYGRMWADAQGNQDWDKLETIRQEVQVLGLDITSVMKSASSYRTKRETEHISRTFSPEARAQLQSLGLPGF